MNGIIPVQTATLVQRSERDLEQDQQNPLAAGALVASRTPHVSFGPITGLTTALRNRLSRHEAEPLATPHIGENRQASIS
jgi:hypothetical protein